MRLFFHAVFVATFLVSATARAEETRETVGVGRLMTNDVFATVLDDRWRTGSGVFSFVTAGAGRGDLPGRLGDLIEVRFRGEVITPENIVTPRPGDRPYASAWSLGLHTHGQFSWGDLSLGADLVVTGPQTGLSTFQSAVHNVLGVSEPSAATLAGQIPNNIYGAFTGEVSRRIPLSAGVVARPFAEVQFGVENLARIGGDLHIGRLAAEEFMLRDQTTGHRYRVRRGTETGWAAVLGADLAYVDQSVYLPASSVVLEDTRSRARAGLHWQGKSIGLFYGLTWMSEEFTAQRESQTVGSVRLDIVF